MAVPPIPGSTAPRGRFGMSGWLPIKFVLDGYPALVWPGLVPEARVSWMHFGNRRLSEPFFSQTVAQIREVDCSGSELLTDVRAIIREGGRVPPQMPAGFIFHVSRCGSTLLCNALKVLENVQVAA